MGRWGRVLLAVAGAAAARIPGAVVGTATGLAVPQGRVDVHAVGLHGLHRPRGVAGAVVDTWNIRGGVMDHAACDVLAELRVLTRVHQERVPPDVHLLRG